MSEAKSPSSPASRATATSGFKERNEIERSSVGPHDPALSREARISELAYRRAEARGFLPGAELEDWLAAEREIETASASNARGEPA